jgi:hypothetical protein
MGALEGGPWKTSLGWGPIQLAYLRRPMEKASGGASLQGSKDDIMVRVHWGFP